LQLVLSVLLNRGDKVILTDPGYPCNRNFVRLLGGESMPVAVTAQTQFQPTLADLDATLPQRPKALLLASPANPTGSVLSVDHMQDFSRWSQQHGVSFIVDEIYQGLEFDAPSHTALANDHAELFVINSFSKYFGMTGWRLGWVVAPMAYVDALERLAQNLFLAAPTLAQYAALQAFSAETLSVLDARCQQLKARRDYLLPALQALGFVIPHTPQGAFYLYADCSRFTPDSLTFCQQLLEDTGVAITPGQDFGDKDAHRHCRFAYTAPIERLQEAVARLSGVLGP
jgi:aspartate/methionine/tyrosine aminotransferase